MNKITRFTQAVIFGYPSAGSQRSLEARHQHGRYIRIHSHSTLIKADLQ